MFLELQAEVVRLKTIIKGLQCEEDTNDEA